MARLLLLILCCTSFYLSRGQALTRQQYREDFDFLWQTIKDNYCYWDKKATDWEKVKNLYAPSVDTITSNRSFVGLLERVLYELYDHHVSLNTNTRESQRLVPSGADSWAEYVDGKPLITEVRQDYGAWKAGLRAGMELVAFNDQLINKAIQSFTAKALKRQDQEASNYALRVLLAGNHSDQRKITVSDKGVLRHFYPDSVRTINDYTYPGRLESNVLKGSIGYIRINNSLWDNALIPLFDSVLNTMMGTKALILDMRETPSGGNTTVARAIIGRFITKQGLYQVHELTAEERQYGVKRSWQEIVSPRKDPYTKPLVVLANHWTGSVGEGIVIGFDALRRATVIGTRMAGLNGAIYSYQMPHTKIGFSFPVEKLFHVNGVPREDYGPPVVVKFRATGIDQILQVALHYLQKRN
ncbi:MAG TPA: S41 family peptidase [Chitinophagaceae bacterium]